MALGAQVIRGGEAGISPSNYVYDSGIDPLKTLSKELKERKQERKDFYQAQVDEISSLNDYLKGAQGKDFTHMQNSILGVRDEIKKLFKTSNPRNYNSPDFQTKLFQLKDKLASVKNGIDTFQNQSAQALQYSGTTPFAVRGEINNYIKQQSELAPEERDQNLLNTIQNDPKFFNPYAYASSSLSTAKPAKALFTKDDLGDKDLINVVEQSYNPLLYKQVGNTIKFEPDEQFVDQLLQDNRFKTQMMNMLPPEVSKSVADNGNSDLIGEELRDQTKEYLRAVAEKQFSPSEKLVANKLKPRPKSPTVAERKELNQKQEAAALLDNIQVDPYEAVRSLAVGENETGYHSFAPVRDEAGNVIGIEAKFRSKRKGNGRFQDTIEQFPIVDFASALNFINKTKYYTKAKQALDEKITQPSQTTPVKGSSGIDWN